TIERLPALISDPGLKKQVEADVDAARQAAQFATDRRNRRLAHRDLRLALGVPVAPLAPASHQAVEEALEALRDTMNRIQLAACGSTVYYQGMPLAGDAEGLLYVLRDGLHFADEREERWNRGDVRPEEHKGLPDV